MAKETTTTGGARGGIAKPVTPSADLAKITGSDQLPRSEVVSKMWDYIKKHDLVSSSQGNGEDYCRCGCSGAFCLAKLTRVLSTTGDYVYATPKLPQTAHPSCINYEPKKPNVVTSTLKIDLISPLSCYSPYPTPNPRHNICASVKQELDRDGSNCFRAH